MFVDVATVNVDEPEFVMLAGLNVPVAPVGNPLTFNVTVPVKLFVPATAVVNGVVAPCFTDCNDGETPNVKSGGPVTVIVRVGGCGSVMP